MTWSDLNGFLILSCPTSCRGPSMHRSSVHFAWNGFVALLDPRNALLPWQVSGHKGHKGHKSFLRMGWSEITILLHGVSRPFQVYLTTQDAEIKGHHLPWCPFVMSFWATTAGVNFGTFSLAVGSSIPSTPQTSILDLQVCLQIDLVVKKIR